MKIAQLPTLAAKSAGGSLPNSDPAADRDELLRYLRSGRVIRAARTLAPDELDPDRTPAVPITAVTDGEWIWSGAVTYYAEHHDVPVDPGLVDHARTQGFRVADVSDAAIATALKLLDSGTATTARQGADSDA